MLGTVYGVLDDGTIRNIKTGSAKDVIGVWKTKDPIQFEKIGYFTERGGNRLRKVIKSESVQARPTE